MKKRIARREAIPANQAEFSPILFDTLFGLLIFLGIDSFFDITEPVHFAFYLTGAILIGHWWLRYKAADDTFGLEVNNSTIDLVFGVLEIVLLEYAIILAANAEYRQAAFFFLLPLVSDTVWSYLWLYLGKWRRSSAARIAFMEQELESGIRVNLITVAVLAGLIVAAPWLSAAQFVGAFIAVTAFSIYLTFRYDLVDIKWF